MATGSQKGLQWILMGDTEGRRVGRQSTRVIDATSTNVPERERTR